MFSNRRNYVFTIAIVYIFTVSKNVLCTHIGVLGGIMRKQILSNNTVKNENGRKID